MFILVMFTFYTNWSDLTFTTLNTINICTFYFLSEKMLWNQWCCSKFVGDPTSMTSMETLKYPMVKKAKHLDIDLNPGDMLYIPSGW